ncbi:MAG: sigma-70 family RNA polymerase sigma factor [bacterium]
MNFDEGTQIYLREIGGSKILTKEEEIALFKRLEARDESVREEIVQANLRFVVRIASTFAGKGLSMSDLIQEGTIGLLEVIDKFDYHKGFRFSTYAAFWIRQSIQLALRKNGCLIRLPIRKSRMLGKIGEFVANRAKNTGKEPTLQELAEFTSLPEKKLERLLRLRDSVLSLDSVNTEDGSSLLDTVPAPQESTPFEACHRKQMKEKVSQVMGYLNEKERRVLRLRYGFERGKALSLRGASRYVGLSQEGVRRVEHKALGKLRRPSIRAYIAGLI